MRFTQLDAPMTAIRYVADGQDEVGNDKRKQVGDTVEFWADIRKPTTKEFIEKHIETNKTTMVFTVWYSIGQLLTTKHTVVYQDEEYNVKEIEYGGDRRDYALVKVVKN